MMVLFAGTVFAKSVEEKRTETREKAEATLQELYERQSGARYEVENSHAYAVFFNTGIKVGILGSSHGRGVAYNNVTGEECFMNMKELSAGLGLGVKEYSLVFIFENQDVWEHFTSGDWTCGGGTASAGATDGESGGGSGRADERSNRTLSFAAGDESVHGKTHSPKLFFCIHSC